MKEEPIVWSQDHEGIWRDQFGRYWIPPVKGRISEETAKEASRTIQQCKDRVSVLEMLGEQKAWDDFFGQEG